MMEMEGDALRLIDREDRLLLPIDHFLESLAAQRGPLAMAVILSGTGTDGTRGAQEIKVAEGIVAAQAPESAEYPGMPKSAISTGLVDFVLRPAEMPAALVGCARRLRGEAGATTDLRSSGRPAPFNEMFALLRERTGHDFSGYKLKTVTRRVQRRMAVHGIDDFAAYLRLLREQPAERDRLFRELIIPVTGFFRDSEAFEALANEVIPRILAQRSGDATVRIWVPACSTGEEAYSIAMLLDEALEGRSDRPAVQIFATDIDTAALQKTRRGRYPASIAAEVGEARLRRYFTRDGDFYEVTPALREMLVCAEQDILKDPPFPRIDLISCRNLLIYLGVELQRRLMPILHYALREGGFLFLGTAEGVADMDDLFTPFDSRWKLYSRRPADAARLAYVALPRFSALVGRAPIPAEAGEASDPVDYRDLVQRVLLREHVPAAVLVDGHNRLLYVHGRTGAFLEAPSGYPTEDLTRMLRPGLDAVVRGALQRVRGQKNERVVGMARIRLAGSETDVRVTAHSIDENDGPPGSALVLFEELESKEGSAGGAKSDDEVAPDHERIALERELAETREELQATIEEMETANEELQSSNEELQSSNEELETSREELQSVNDELRSVNAELQAKVVEANSAREEMNTLLASTDIGIIFVDDKLCIERFTPAVRSIIPVRDSDIGRPIGELSHTLCYNGLRDNLASVIASLTEVQHRVRGEDDRTYMLRMRPYRSTGGSVIGAVMVFVDVTEEDELAFLGKLRDALGQSRDMVMLVRLDGGIEYVNEAFCEASGYTADEVVGHGIDALAAPGLSAESRRRMDWNLRQGGTWRGAFQYSRRDGTTLETDAFFAPVRATTGEVSHAVAYLQPAEGPC